MAIAQNFPKIRPSLNLSFALTKALDPRITYARASAATYYNANGLLESAAAGEARFDHNPVTGESLGLLIEESRTNLLTYSEQFDNAGWTKSNSSITANTIVAPDGTLSADLLVENTANSAHNVRRDGTSVTSGLAYTLSFFAKSAGRTSVLVTFGATFFGTDSAAFDLADGTSSAVVGSPTHSIQSVGNGWYRCVFTLTAVSTGSAAFTPNIALRSGTSTTYTGDGFSGIYIWGAQVEAGAFPTSYIPTVASQVTRSADAASMTGANFSSVGFNPAEGTLFADFRPMGSGFSGASQQSSGLFGFDDTTDTGFNGYGVRYRRNGSINAVTVISRKGATTSEAGPNVGFVVDGQAYKIAGTYNVDALVASVNNAGTNNTLNQNAALNRPNRVLIGRLSVGGQNPVEANARLSKLAYYPKRLTNAELQGLTS